MTMKKFFYSTLVLALSSMLFFSCSKSDDVVVNDEDVIVKATLIAGNPVVDPGTKTEVHGTTPYWSVGDAIGVTNGTDSNEKFNSSITSASTTATFSGETVSGDLYAYHPYSTGGVSTSGASIALSAEQNPSATSFDGSADVLVSKMFTVTPENTTVSGLVFKRLTSVIKVVLKDTENQLNGEHPTFVSVEADNNLIGNVLVDFAGQSLSLQSNPSKKVTANYTAATQFEIDGTNGAYLVVLPQTLAGGSTLIVKANTENYYIEKTITIPASGIDIPEGKITTLNISLPSGTVTHHPVINVTSANPMKVDNVAGTYTISYGIDDFIPGETLSAAEDETWISNVTVGSEGVTFKVDEQAINAPERTGYITLSYKDAEDVVVTVKQRKGRILATLVIAQNTNINSLADDKGNTWTFASNASNKTVEHNNTMGYFIQAGGPSNDKFTNLTITSSGCNNFIIYEIFAWGSAAVDNEATMSIYRGSSSLKSETVATLNAAGTTLTVDNNIPATGEVKIEIKKSKSEKGALYFHRLSILYDEKTFADWLAE